MADRGPLAEFLRARREQTSPAQVGLRTTGRRRTPGLRREELATLAGVSIDYLVRIEQGRDTHPSAAVVSALADALQLEGEERTHFFRLGAIAGRGELCPSAPALVDAVSDRVQFLLDQLDPTPAFVLGPINDIVGSNRTWRTLAGPLGLTDHPNLARHLFLHPDARTIHGDWDAAADAQVSHLRTASMRLGDEPGFVQLLADLADAPGFEGRWASHAVAEPQRGAVRIDHPAVGTLHVDTEVMALADDEQRLVAWIPADEATAIALRTVVTADEPVSPAVLRVVGEG